jgi:curved DNA-binding protein CbpA
MSSFSDKDYYSTLGVSPLATLNQIKSSYKKLALHWHPDRNKEPGADEMFKIISEAYEVLSSPEKRAKYDLYVKVRAVPGEKMNEPSPYFNPFGVNFGTDFKMYYTRYSSNPYVNGGSQFSGSSFSTWGVPFSSLRERNPNGLYSNVNRQRMSGVVNITKEDGVDMVDKHKSF